MPDTLTYPPALLADLNHHYGLQVSHLGEDGALFVLGHHDETRRVVAAIRAEERLIAGERITGSLTEFLIGLRETHALYFEDSGDWLIQWGMTSSESGAFPITVWEP